jgi:hypothetical protein
MDLKALPAIYATKPYPGVSSSYVFIPTKPIVEGLIDSGWSVVGASQTKSRSEERAPYARHMLRFRHEDFEKLEDPRGGELFPEMILVNGHDGTATYRLFSGLFSFICSNGLIVGTMLGGATVRHSGYAATLEAVQFGAVKIITEELPVLMRSVRSMATRVLTRSEQHDFARRALELRYHGLSPLLTTDQVLERHRDKDAANDAWTTLNVIQENILSRTHSGRSFSGRRSNIRAVRAIKEQVNINRGLWDHAIKLAA